MRGRKHLAHLFLQHADPRRQLGCVRDQIGYILKQPCHVLLSWSLLLVSRTPEPGFQLIGKGDHDGAVLRGGPMNRHTCLRFPTLSRANTSLKMAGNLFPSVQNLPIHIDSLVTSCID
jgi:hypothetical protein